MALRSSLRCRSRSGSDGRDGWKQGSLGCDGKGSGVLAGGGADAVGGCDGAGGDGCGLARRRDGAGQEGGAGVGMRESQGRKWRAEDAGLSGAGLHRGRAHVCTEGEERGLTAEGSQGDGTAVVRKLAAGAPCRWSDDHSWA